MMRITSTGTQRFSMSSGGLGELLPRSRAAATTDRTVLQDSGDGRIAVRGSLGEERRHVVGVEAGEGGADGGQVVAATQDGAVGPDDGGAGAGAV